MKGHGTGRRHLAKYSLLAKGIRSNVQMSSSHSQFPTAQQLQDFFGLGFDPLSDPVAYPHLNPTELEEVAPFGERCTFAENDPLVSAGDYPFNSYVILSGTVRAVDISTGERVVFVRYGAGYFTGDNVNERPDE